MLSIQDVEYRSVNCCIPCIGYCGRNFCRPNRPVRVCRAVSRFSGFANCGAGIDQIVNPNTSTNGCSIPADAPIPLKRFFTPSCNAHDVCYNTCESGQGQCDKAFQRDMESACTSRRDRPQCLFWSAHY